MTPGGLAPERTTLAWTRTALSLVGCAAAVVRLAAGRGSIPAAALGTVAALAAAVLLRAIRPRPRPPTAPPGAGARAIAGTAGTALLLCVTAFLLVT